MHYFKRLVSGFSLGVLFTIETAFYATPPANAQLDNDCALYAVGYAAQYFNFGGRVNTDLVADITGAMIGPNHNADTITNMLRTVGLGPSQSYQTFYSLEALEEYLRNSNGNAQYIVGWQRNQDPQGHVVNARVINGGPPFYIDAQCGSFTRPPTGIGYAYYAWFVEPITFLRARDLENSPSGQFTRSCQNITLSTDFDRNNSVALSADCRNEAGGLIGTGVDISGYIINSFGSLAWQDNGGFGASVRNCQLRISEVTVLLCEAADGNGSWRKAAINLDKKIANRNGRLTVEL